MNLGIKTSSLLEWAPWLRTLGVTAELSARHTMSEAPETTEAQEDDALFARIANGDETAFAAFYDRHETLLYSIAHRIGGTDAEAEDVLQEAAVLIWERAPTYNRSLGKPLSWAIAIVRNKAIDRFRSGKRRSEVFAEMPEDPVAEAGQATGSDPRAFAGEDATFVRRALATLAREQRQAIEMAFFGGLTQNEIAEQLGQPLGTIKARIRRGMIQMRDALEGAL